MTLSSLDPLAGIVPNLAPMPVRLDALAGQDCRRGLFSSTLFQADAGPEGIVESAPSLVESPSTENMVDSLPTGIGRGEQAPGNSSFENIEDGVDHQSPVRWRSAKLFGFRKHGHEELPLSVGQIGIVGGIFHAPTAGTPQNENDPTNS